MLHHFLTLILDEISASRLWHHSTYRAVLAEYSCYPLSVYDQFCPRITMILSLNKTHRRIQPRSYADTKWSERWLVFTDGLKEGSSNLGRGVEETAKYGSYIPRRSSKSKQPQLQPQLDFSWTHRIVVYKMWRKFRGANQYLHQIREEHTRITVYLQCFIIIMNRHIYWEQLNSKLKYVLPHCERSLNYQKRLRNCRLVQKICELESKY